MEKSVPASRGGSPGTPKARKADPAIYSQLRRNALEVRLPNLEREAVHAVLMDWHVNKGTVTVLAAADGSASLYLSSGGGFIGGSQKVPALRDAALHAVSLANSLQFQFEPTDTTPLPSLGDVTFFLTTGKAVLMAVASEAKLRAGADPLAALSGAMQRIVTEYRLNFGKGRD